MASHACQIFLEQSKPLLLVFGGYLFAIAGFAYAYWCLYRKDPSSFHFLSTIIDARVEELRSDLVARLAGTQTRLSVIRALLENLSSAGAQASETSNLWGDTEYALLVHHWRATFSVDVSTGGPGLARAATKVLGLTDLATSASSALDLPDTATAPRTLEDWRELLQWADERLARGAAALDTRLSTLTRNRDAWNYLDFLYFSLISQTTVGYGDILPNSTKVRVLVSLQILLGYALLVVVLNIVIASQL